MPGCEENRAMIYSTWLGIHPAETEWCLTA